MGADLISLSQAVFQIPLRRFRTLPQSYGMLSPPQSRKLRVYLFLESGCAVTFCNPDFISLPSLSIYFWLIYFMKEILLDPDGNKSLDFSGYPRILASIVYSLRIAFIEIHSFIQEER